MLPSFYQTVLRQHLNEKQYLTLELLILLLQSYRNISLSHLARVFPQPIQYESRLRNLQRFLLLPRIAMKVLWFPIIKHWLCHQIFSHRPNRTQRRRRRRIKHLKHGYVVVVMD
jgi:hypothetical protein